MDLFNQRWWRRTATVAMLIGLLCVVGLGLADHPVAACRAFAFGLGLLGCYRLFDRSANSWLAVRGWVFDSSLLFILAVIIYAFSRYGGVLMPQTVS